ncbi:MAG: hypothetical protein ABEI31_08000 [Halodesulfurarchaeum sp.]
MRVERSFRGISRRLAREYLVGLGGTEISDRRVEGEDWTATLTTETVSVGPTLELTEVTVVFEGTEDRVESVVEAFARKAMRAGG